MKVGIIGAGMTGLTTAYYLEKLGCQDIHIFETGLQVGGKIGTMFDQDCLVELGPDCFFTRKPDLLELVDELGLNNQLISPLMREFGLFTGGKLQIFPRELANLTQLTDETIDLANFVSEAGRAQAKQERLQPKGDGKDESMTSFYGRRFGLEFYAKVIEPLMAGTYGSGGDTLSMAALYPRFIDREQRIGFISAEPGAAPTPSKDSFMTFRDGMATLPMAIESRLHHTTYHFKTSIADAKAFSDLTLEFDRLLVAIQSPQIIPLLPELEPILSRIPHSTAVISSLCADIPSDAELPPITGFLVPIQEQRMIKGCTWSSSKWEHRAPKGKLLVRAFLSGERVDLNALSDEEYMHMAFSDIELAIPGMKDWFGIGSTIFTNTMPQYQVGHLELLKELDTVMAKFPHVYLAGASFGGVGIPDCVRQGRETAYKMMSVQ